MIQFPRLQRWGSPWSRSPKCPFMESRRGPGPGPIHAASPAHLAIRLRRGAAKVEEGRDTPYLNAYRQRLEAEKHQACRMDEVIA
ncbi:unnamed protein product [Merluccius merluccius]